MKIGVDNNNSDSLAARKQFTKMLVNKERHLQYYCKCLSEKSQEKQKRRRGIVICKSKFLLGMEFNLTNASVIYLWNLVLQIAFTSGIVSKIPYKQTRCNR